MSLDTSEFLDALMEESLEALDAMEVSLLELDHGGDDTELINTIFRGAHSIKGGCGMLGLDEIASFTHVMETLLDKVRDGEISVDMPLTGLLLECVDAVRGMFDALSNDESSDRALIDNLVERLTAALEGRKDDVLPITTEPVQEPESEELLNQEPEPQESELQQEIETVVVDEPIKEAVEVVADPESVPEMKPDQELSTHIDNFAPEPLPEKDNRATVKGQQDWIIQLTPPSDLIAQRMDITAQFKQLDELGEAVVLGLVDNLPNLSEVEPETCYLRWSVNLTSAQSFEEIRAHLASGFPQWQVEIHAEKAGQMTPEDSREFSQLMDVLRGELATEAAQSEVTADAVAEQIAAVSEPVVVMAEEVEVAPIAETSVVEAPAAVAEQVVTEQSVSKEPEAAQVETLSAETLSVEAKSEVDKPADVKPIEPKPESKAEKPKSKAKPKPVAKERKQADTGSIRVSTQKIDTLINMAGELVITQAMLTQQGEKLMESGLGNLENLWDGLGQLERNLRELQDAVMSIRMLPISFAFSRFPRMIRDLNARIGKNVRLETSGEQTELDKTVMEKIGDPLVHLVRNSFDHGIELPEERRAAGKDEQGVIELNAYHQGGNIVIEVVDDGKGLDREKIIAKARERGLLGVEEEVADEKALELIFEPGFSTAEQVSDLSGRGVGMDVVRRNIRELGGNIELTSEVGKGTKFTIRLPLTLAILDGQLVYVGGETFVIPLLSIIESIQIDKQLLSTVAGSRQLYQLRDEYIPVVSLYELFGLSRTEEAIDHDLLVVIEGDGKKIGLRVDDLLGQQQAFIKSLETNYKQVPGVSGATILGDGTVSLILDAGAIVRLSGCAD